MKRIILFFTAVVIMGTTAFAVEHAPENDPAMCAWRQEEGLSNNMPSCETLIKLGRSLGQKCCWRNPICANLPTYLTMETCESTFASGQSLTNGPFCCWESRENASNLGNGKGNKGAKKTPIKTSVKAKKVNTLQPVKANATKVPAQTKADTKNSK